MPYVDTHVHLDQSEFDGDREAVIERARQAAVEAIVCVGITADSSEAALKLACDHQSIHAAVGIQPNYCAEAAEGDWERIVAMASGEPVVALGETGLDRHWDFAPFALQKEYFVRHLELARRCGLPVAIHCREAEADLMPLLHQAATGGPLRGVLHAFGGDAALAAECVELGLYVSFAGAVTYRNKKFASLRAAAAAVPDDRIVIETDSPYLVPHPLRGKRKRNEPAWIVHTAACLAELRGVSVDELAAQTTANARRLFGIT
jgi:TatD DNase family protein